MSSESLIDIACPSKGDKLFTEDGGMWNSYINWTRDEEKHHLYERSFADASAHLIDYMVSERIELDSFIYPVIFCFRHSLELELKDMIRTGLTFSDYMKISKVPDTHDILHLLSIVKKLLSDTFPDEDKSPLSNVERCIREIDDLDKKSMSFRYPADRDGNQHLSGLNYINTKNLQKTMKAINNFFGAASNMLSMARDHHFEMLHEYNCEY